MDLKEIRDNERFTEDGFAKWEHYLNQRVSEAFGIKYSQVQNLIQCAEVRPKLPDLENLQRVGESCGWSQRSVQEFARLAPDSNDDARKKNYAALKKVDATRVAKAAVEIAEEEAKGTESEAVAVTSRHVRKAVDIDLGIERDVKPEPEPQMELAEYIRRNTGRIEGLTNNLGEVTADAWKLLEESHPGLAARMATACEGLAAYLRF